MVFFFVIFLSQALSLEQSFKDLQCDVEQPMNSYSNREPENYNQQNISVLKVFENQSLM